MMIASKEEGFCGGVSKCEGMRSLPGISRDKLKTRKKWTFMERRKSSPRERGRLHTVYFPQYLFPTRKSVEEEELDNKKMDLSSLLFEVSAPGEAVMVVTSVLYVVQSVVVKVLATRFHVPALEVVTYRSVVAGCVTLRLVMAKKREEVPLDTWLFGRRDLRTLVVLRGLVGGLAQSFSYSSLRYLGIGEHCALIFVNPLWMIIMGVARGEDIGSTGLASLIVGGIGAALVSSPGSFSTSYAVAGERKRSLGIVMALASALLIATAMFLVRVIGKKVPAESLGLSFHLFSAAIAANGLALGLQRPAFPATAAAICLTIFASLSSFLLQPLASYAYAQLTPLRASCLGYSQLPIAILLGLFFRPHLNILQLIGAALILLAGFLLAFFRDDAPLLGQTAFPSHYPPIVVVNTNSTDQFRHLPSSDNLLDDTDNIDDDDDEFVI